MEQELIDIAIDNLSAITGTLVEAHDTTSSDNGLITVYGEEYKLTFPFHAKLKVSNTNLPFLLECAKSKKVIIFESVSKTFKEELRRLSINYIEASGNSYINQKGLFLFVDTQKKVKLNTTSDTAFSKAGLKVIYQLLLNKEVVNENYRIIGKLAGTSIDTVRRVYKELVRDHYIIKVDDRIHKVDDYERLFHDWVTVFNKILRPKLKKRAFRFRAESNVRAIFDFNFNGKIGGELAAAKISSLIAEQTNIYVEGSFVDLAKQMNLIPDKDGEITMIEPFWNVDVANSDVLVGLPLIYADLISMPKPRNLEVANILLKKYV